MKAIIVEVYRDYCIAISEDGQFLKEKIPAGIHEIGDEIVISQPVAVKAGERTRIFQIVSRAAIGFAAVAVIIIGSYFGVQYIRTGTTSSELAMAPEEKDQEVRSAAAEDTVGSFEGEGESVEITVETVMADEAAGEEPATEEAMALEESADVVETTLKSLEELFSGTFSLEQLDKEIMIENEAMFVSYRVDKMKDQEEALSGEERIKELTLKFKNMTESTLFDGNADIMLLHSDMTVSEIEKILFENMDYNQQNTKKIPFYEETNFRLIVFGVFK
jgi:hypothetical protein